MSRGLARFFAGAVASFGLAAVVWEAFAWSGLFSPALSPSLRVIVPTLVGMVSSGMIFLHIGYTLYRILWGLALALLLGIPVGLLMGRFKAAERFVLPLVSVLSPIPSLAWVPVFILWFGLGDAASIALVFYAATFPVVLNTWTGVRSVNRLWIRAAQAMGAGGADLFRKVVLPGSLPFVIAGFRQAFARSWIAVVGGEMIAATNWGLGWVIFDSKEFLRADMMLGTLIVIGVLGVGFERLVFQQLERRTVGRWGMVRTAKA
ncbi:MAG: ABC transporter permease [Candidatus Rokubacteria bacterium]|nr:ABC transporter permease [Candidatus Rokubacteria bacterium]